MQRTTFCGLPLETLRRCTLNKYTTLEEQDLGLETTTIWTDLEEEEEEEEVK